MWTRTRPNTRAAFASQPAAACPENHPCYYTRQSRKPASKPAVQQASCCLQQQPRQQGDGFWNSRPRLAGTSLITKSLPSSCLGFQLRINQRKPSVTPNQPHWMPCFWPGHLQTPPPHPQPKPPIWAHLKPLLFHHQAGSQLCLLGVSAHMQGTVADSLPISRSE